MTRVLLVSQPGIVQDATLSILGMARGLVLAGVAAGALSATRLLDEIEVDLLLIDANVPADEVLALLEWASSRRPALQRVVMAPSHARGEQALGWGAHAAVQRANLANELETMLSRPARALTA
jgi:DNA-binding NarL/FixJ family response regulator